MHVLVTGGAGFLGRHVCLGLAKAGHSVEILDSFSRGRPKDVMDLEEQIGCTIPTHPIDLWQEAASLHRLFSNRSFDAVVHLAGLKPGATQESGVAGCCAIEIGGTMNLLACMEAAGCKQLVFCSTVSVYGDREDGTMAWREEEWPAGAHTPPSAYGAAKDAIERVLRCLKGEWTIRVLRCPEIAGSLPDGALDDTDPSSTVPRFLSSTHADPVTVRSGHPDTADGSIVRDYIHVTDAASAHVLAVEDLSRGGVEEYNLGTGKGTSTWQLLLALQRAVGAPIPSRALPVHGGGTSSRAGVRLSNTRKIRDHLGWTPALGITDICLHAKEAVEKKRVGSKDAVAWGTSVGAGQSLDASQ